jgi:hypothetical protein
MIDRDAGETTKKRDAGENNAYMNDKILKI